MEDKEDSNLSFDLSCEEKLPNNAVVYTIAMEGVRTTAVNSVAVTNSKINKTVNLTLYLWKKSDLVSMKMPLKSELLNRTLYQAISADYFRQIYLL